jgi:hypothetical protein
MESVGHEPSAGDSIYRDTPKHKYVGPPRLWMDSVQIAGVVVTEPRVYYPRGKPGRLGATRCMFRLFTYAPGENKCYVTCWASGYQGDLAAECIHKNEQIVVFGALQTFFYKPQPGKKRMEGAGYNYVRVERFFQIPWREESHFRHGTVPVPTERYHEMMHELDEKRRPFEAQPSQLDALIRSAGQNALSFKEIEEAKRAAQRARQRYACVLPPDALQSSDERDRVQDGAGEDRGPQEAGEAETGLGEA